MTKDLKNLEPGPGEIKDKATGLILPKEESITIKNVVTGKQTEVVISREGMNDSNLGLVLTDPTSSRAKKDAMVGQWLFQRGMDSASFLAELFATKGAHTKETRAFKSQVRFDFTAFVDTFTTFLDSCQGVIFKNLGITDKEALYKDYLNYAKRNAKSGTVCARNFYKEKGYNKTDEFCALVDLALHHEDEAKKLRELVQKVTEERMRAEGYGVLIGKDGKSYSILDDDILEVVTRERERAIKLREEENGN